MPRLGNLGGQSHANTAQEKGMAKLNLRALKAQIIERNYSGEGDVWLVPGPGGGFRKFTRMPTDKDIGDLWRDNER